MYRILPFSDRLGINILSYLILRLKCYNTQMTDCCIHIHLQHHNDTTIKTDAWIKDACRKTQEWRTQEDFFTVIFTSHFICKISKGLFKGLHVRGCWRPNINFIFWPHCYDRHVVSFLFSWCWGLLHRGFSEGPLGRVWPFLPHLVSSCLEVCWQLLWHPTQLNYIIIQRLHDRPLDLWNRMFNRH